jgi:protein-disulfide isomerase-like protein with CxxC motif
MCDRLLKGRLEDRMRECRQAGMSFAEIARRLYVEGRVEVTAETLRVWARELGIKDSEAA